MLVLFIVESRCKSLVLWDGVMIWLMWMMQSMVTSGFACTRLQHERKIRTQSSNTCWMLWNQYVVSESKYDLNPFYGFMWHLAFLYLYNYCINYKPVDVFQSVFSFQVLDILSNDGWSTILLGHMLLQPLNYCLVIIPEVGLEEKKSTLNHQSVSMKKKATIWFIGKWQKLTCWLDMQYLQ